MHNLRKTVLGAILLWIRSVHSYGPSVSSQAREATIQCHVRVNFDDIQKDELSFLQTVRHQQCSVSRFESFSNLIKREFNSQVWPREVDMTDGNSREGPVPMRMGVQYYDGWQRTGQPIDFDPYPYEWISFNSQDMLGSTGVRDGFQNYCWVKAAGNTGGFSRGNQPAPQGRSLNMDCSNCEQRMIGPLLHWTYRGDLPPNVWEDARRHYRIWEKRFGEKCGRDWLQTAYREYTGPQELRGAPSRYEQQGFGAPEYRDPDIDNNQNQRNQAPLDFFSVAQVLLALCGVATVAIMA